MPTPPPPPHASDPGQPPANRPDGRAEMIPSTSIGGPIVADRPRGATIDPAVTRRRVVAIVNPATHGDAASIIALLREQVPPGLDLEVCPTQSAGTTTALAR